jgi:hypothetical protein
MFSLTYYSTCPDAKSKNHPLDPSKTCKKISKGLFIGFIIIDIILMLYAISLVNKRCRKSFDTNPLLDYVIAICSPIFYIFYAHIICK